MATTVRLPALWLCAFTLGGCEVLSNEGDTDAAVTPAPAPPNLIREPPVELAQESIDVSGGTLVVARPGDPLDGLRLEVPSGAFPEARTFTLSFEAIIAHELGGDFTVLSPLITISNGGGYAATAMVMTVPISLPEGHFAMAFAYDEASGRLEGLPIGQSAADRVTFYTRHFAHNVVNGDAPLIRTGALSEIGQRAGALEEDARSRVLITSIDRSKLSDGETGYVPGADDAPFTNWGSHIAPRGFCLGSSLASIWYFMRKRVQEGAPSMWTTFAGDDLRHAPPGVWQDDASGIKLASLCQTDYGSTVDLESLATDGEVFDAFRYAIKATHAPQFAAIVSADRNTGHAIVVYGIGENALFVADPNQPGNKERRIEFDPSTGTFDPYFASPIAGGQGVAYTSISYAGLTSYFAWNSPRQRFAEIEAGTIGEGSFPTYTLSALDENVEEAPLVDGFKVRDRYLSVFVNSPGFQAAWQVLDAAGTPLPLEIGGTGVVLPATGTQWIGVVITDENSKWAGFNWIEVCAEDGEPICGTPTVPGDPLCPTVIDACAAYYASRGTLCGETPADLCCLAPCSCASHFECWQMSATCQEGRACQFGGAECMQWYTESFVPVDHDRCP